MVHELLHEERNDRGVRSVGVLPAAENIEISQADVLGTVGAGEHVGVELVHVLRDGIGRKRPADNVLDFRQSLAVSVSGTAGGKNKTLDSCVLSSYHHVEESTYVHGVGSYGVLDGAGDGAEGRLVEHVLHAAHGLAAVLDVADISYCQFKVLRILFKQRQDVLNMPCSKIVKTANSMSGL